VEDVHWWEREILMELYCSLKALRCLQVGAMIVIGVGMVDGNDCAVQVVPAWS
jgi:hypothetical protein